MMAIPDLNLPYNKTEESDTEMILPTKSNNCVVRTAEKTPATTINKYKTVASSKLIGMGCPTCYMYVMVPEDHKICPRCGQGEQLIDVAAHVHANKKRAT